ncbi:NADH-quinone oxidoreductase subunit L [Candidatus Hydrogenisulfobacillus filiaventi]|uniref:NADH-quinone oxidoreductase subunit L n=1 Tax=Candidatus Hydrogenisulfobacillus filiaventi TaxID=2707344 RepID=A0A6F8ZI53_9FIRM|nr:NADH-quinone oxidoreductase subunit L [Bacillota bacterium]CAB1129332.1 NADH-quinone oxidoreductase subunit L [Candidatus Hydrogenisulfobacillus filiaventi]
MHSLELGLLVLLGAPLAGAVLIALTGDRTGPRGPAVLAAAAAGVAFLAALALSLAHSRGAVTVAPWVRGFGPVIRWRLAFTPLGEVWALIITGVGFLIHVYSAGYMAEEDDRPRYFAGLNFFLFAMLLVVTADNLLILLLGWAGVGLASYLLIGFWYRRPSAVLAARKAFVMNTIGDAGILLGLTLLVAHYGSARYGAVFAGVTRHPVPGLAVASALLLYVGAMAKSAQLPLHTWLVDAMEGPTPVSALIHAATMVTAGVYLMTRFYPLLGAAPGVGETVAVIGTLTALYAALAALRQRDIKRVLAYSTISQLGYMFLAVGVGAYTAAVFHFVTHAFFKALLFLAAGNVIHVLEGEQDLGRMGGLARSMPYTAAAFGIGALALAGIPPLAGFFSKDAILAQSFRSGHPLLGSLGVLTAGLTGYYMARVFSLTFLGPARRPRGEAREAPWVMLGPVLVLAVLAVIGGAFGGGIDRLLAPAFRAWPGAARAALEPPAAGVSLVTVLLAVAGLYGGWREGRAGRAEPAGFWGRGALAGFGLDAAWMRGPVAWTAALGRWLGRVEDRVWIPGTGAPGRWVTGLGRDLRPVQTGLVRRYLLSMAVGLGAVLAYYLLRV